MKKSFVIFLTFFVYSFGFSQSLPIPYNLDFEIGELGYLPKGWVVPSYADNLGYIAYLTDEEPKSGRYCLELFKEGKYEKGTYGSVMQSIDAKPYRGKTIRFRAYIRAEIHSPEGSAHIWVRERFPNEEETGFFEYLPNNPCVLRNWEVREIVGVISPDAEVINFGLLLFGAGKAWIDSASFEVVATKDTFQKEIVWDNRVIDELVDLAKVYGVVRYFHPLSEQNFDWECFLYNSILKIFNSNDRISLKIKSIFYDFLENFSNKEKYFDSTGYISWLHQGYPNLKPHPFIFSKKVNILNPTRKYQGIVQQVINVEKIKKKEFVFSAFVNGRLLDLSSKFVLAVRFDDIDNKQIGYLYQEFQNLTNSEWKKFELKGKVPENSVFAKPAIILVGEGEIFVDNTYFGPSDSDTNLLQNSSFETSKDTLLVFNWRLLDVSKQSGYFAFVSKVRSKEGEKSLLLFSDPATRVSFPSPNENFIIELSDGGKIEVPISISIKKANNISFDKGKYESIQCHYDLDEIISQIALVIDVWNFLVHFNEYFKPIEDTQQVLKSILNKILISYTAKGKLNQFDFLNILMLLTSNIKDNFVRVIHPEITKEKAFPFLWKLIDKKVFITKTGEPNSTFEIGDEVVKINSTPTEVFLDSVGNFVSFSTKEWKMLKSLAYTRNFFPIDSILLTLKKADGRIINVSISKPPRSRDLVEERPASFDFLDKGIVYLDLTRLSEKELKDILDTLKFNGTFIFDLRGIVLTSEQFLSLFTQKTLEYNTWEIPIFAFPFQQRTSKQIVKCRIIGKLLFDPKAIYFLIDERTIGIGEVIADIAKKNKIGILVGSSTGGNPMEMASRIFPGGLTLYFGVFKVKNCDGNEMYGKGIAPNIPVKIRTDKENLTKDQVLEKVLDLIKSKY
ncbi:MAG: S41 family peptidase [Ignavibacteria bacterium]|nr:S41 family peptidase [Ignavibacteria bacterium]